MLGGSDAVSGGVISVGDRAAAGVGVLSWGIACRVPVELEL